MLSSFSNYALINRAGGPYEEIFVLTFKTFGLNAVRFMHLECQNKYFPYGSKSRLIRALLYTDTYKIIYDKILPNKSVVYCVNVLPGPYAVRMPMYGLSLRQLDRRIRSLFQSVSNKTLY